jgi:hypothetical protein
LFVSSEVGQQSGEQPLQGPAEPHLADQRDSENQQASELLTNTTSVLFNGQISLCKTRGAGVRRAATRA